MSFAGGAPGLKAIEALIEARGGLTSIADKDWAAAASLIVKKLQIAAGQTTESLKALRAAVGNDIFDTQLKTLSHHQAKQLAKRLDKTVPDLEVSTARAAIAYILGLLTHETPETATPVPLTQELPAVELEAAPEQASAEAPGTDDSPPSPPTAPNPYFGRKSFRTG